MKVKYIFFDNDGILVDTEHLVGQATVEVLAMIGYQGDGLTLYKEEGMRKGKSLWPLVQKEMGISDEKVQELNEIRYQRYADLLRTQNHAIPGVEEVLQQLRGHLGMAIVTASAKDHFDIIHEKTGFIPYFDFILTREDFKFSKPHPEPYLTAFERARKAFPDLDKRECLVLEDSQRGVTAAKEAGLPCFAIPTDFTRDMDFSRADRVLDRLSDVFKESLIN